MSLLRSVTLAAAAAVLLLSLFPAPAVASPESTRTVSLDPIEATTVSEEIEPNAASHGSEEGPASPPDHASDGAFPFWINATCSNTSSAVLSIEIDGVNTTLPTAGFWQSGSVHNLTVVYREQWFDFCRDCIFSSWGDGSTDLMKTITVNATVEMSVRFLDYYIATATTMPMGHSFEVFIDTLPDGRVLDGWGIDFIEVLVRPGIRAVWTTSPQLSSFDLRLRYFDHWDDGVTDYVTAIDVKAPGCETINAWFSPSGIEVTVGTNVMPGLFVGYDSHPGVEPIRFYPATGTRHTVFTYSPQSNVPGVRHVFDHWVSNVSGPGTSTLSWNLTVPDTDVTYSAIFDASYLIAIDANFVDPAPVVSISGVPACPPGSAPYECWVDEGASPTLAVETTQEVGGCRFVFQEWGDGDTRAVRPVASMTGPLTFNTVWTSECYVSLVMTPTCRGTLSPGTGWYQRAGAVDIEWTPPNLLPPGEWYMFWRWKGTGNGSHSGWLPSASIVVNGPIYETAHCARLREVHFIGSSGSTGSIRPMQISPPPAKAIIAIASQPRGLRQRLIRPLS